MLSTFKREAGYLSGMLRMLKSVKDVDAASNHLLADELEMRVDAFGPNIAFIEDEREWTYDQTEDYANRVAGWCESLGVVKGDTVAVFVRNRLEYVALWFGLSKRGVIPALINFQLAGQALAHCVNISDASHVVVDVDLIDSWKSAREHLDDGLTEWAAFGEVPKGHKRKMKSFDAALSDIVPNRPPKAVREGLTAGGQGMKMFTSGTTGLPKAAKVTHVRAQNYMRGLGAGAKAGPKDRMLLVLPLYHATGGLVGMGSVFSNGGACIIRPKFSASTFWDDAVQYGATMFTYVGELCRFLLSTPPHPLERDHKIEWIIGNGLRPEVWESFTARFNIPHVIEFYGATEGNVSLINLDGPVGAVGRVPSYLKWKFNIDIIRYDVETGENPRGSDGFALRADDDEVGEVIGEIREDDPRFRFDGYQTKEATQKKILRDVFKPGDAWFRTGDLMKRDGHGYYYFIDRVGDTFRWKAENVATNEVAGVLSGFEGVTQANVYGVEVPGYDGRAGMAALVSDTPPDLEKLKAYLDTELPHYARPVFLRLSDESETTSTFKFKKTNLVKAGFDPNRISEPVYYCDPQTGAYERVDAETFEKINSGAIRL
ncbi:long-chain-acyl-CoA synthetase [uncultured Algimonas sp.]|uniref:long-chain-acyl-CoA synthetase n=1 Tax=uncultured Algimonas sp. TaxID=1547920 RepID=UPI002625A430|nr:long-chain-acyl-CoA synthetase [uncultured Algimonas sp.]